MVRGTVLDEPTGYDINEMSVNHYAAVHLKVTSVIASRPDVKQQISVGDTLLVGFNVLDPAKRAEVVNFDSLAQDGFPTQDQVPMKGADVIGFLVATELGEGPNGYESVGYADAGKDPPVMHALPGSLNGESIPLVSIIGLGVTNLYNSPAPWRTTPSASATPTVVSSLPGGSS
jgi:hypothetical protein